MRKHQIDRRTIHREASFMTVEKLRANHAAPTTVVAGAVQQIDQCLLALWLVAMAAISAPTIAHTPAPSWLLRFDL
jgi:hypothetical protein